ncbi:MAG: hypothetical protein WCD51_06230 [Anaerolineae bacterium]
MSRGKQVDNAMSDVAIRVENLSKQYRIGTAQARYETMKVMGACGKARVEKRFTWDKVAQRVTEGHHKVL